MLSPRFDIWNPFPEARNPETQTRNLTTETLNQATALKAKMADPNIRSGAASASCSEAQKQNLET